jgi:phage tail sheath protein FI
MGVRARVDSLADSGPWESPAGQGDFGTLRSALDVATEYSNTEHGLMNDAHINVIRKFSTTSAPVIWGARTLDASVTQKFRYISVRRFFQFVEKSIVDSTRWAVFRNNNADLWSRLKDRISDFLLGLLGDGAFPTTDAATAYFVKIGFADGTMDSDDVDNGRVIGQIALAPNKPGEFIIFRFSQLSAGAEVTEA